MGMAGGRTEIQVGQIRSTSSNAIPLAFGAPRLVSPRIAICFFGITRSLTHTIGSIEANILAPAREVGEVRIFAHFFRQTEIDNPRSGEKGAFRQDEHTLLNPDWLELEDPELCLAEHDFEGLKTYGDLWNDDFRSLRNLVHQLHSLNRVTDAALAGGGDVFIFARPDLFYHDSFAPLLGGKLPSDRIFLPNWQRWGGGYNDRFAIATSERMARLYGKRVGQMTEFCEARQAPLHAELLLKYALGNHRRNVKPHSLRASRVRLGGKTREEDFMDARLRRPLKIVKWLRNKVIYSESSGSRN